VLLTCLSFIAYGYKDYTNCQVLRGIVDSNTLEIMQKENVDIWRALRVNDMWEVDFLKDPSMELSVNVDNFSVLDNSVGHTIETVQKEIDSIKSNVSMDEFFDNFRSYEDWLIYFDLVTDAYPDFVKRFVIGKTYEGRDIHGFEVTAPSSTEKPEIYIQGLVHAREWLAPTNVMWFMMAMISGYGTDPNAKLLLDSFKWTLVPIVNIDGYIFTWTFNRMWRKNRRLNTGGSYGVDLNRNWGPSSTWCSSGSSTNPNSDTYCGTAPWSESESKSVYDYINARRDRMKAGMDFHTYGPLLLWPWQYTFDRLPEPDYSMFRNLGADMVRGINSVHNQNYISQQGSDLYPHSGGFVDYNWEYNDMLTFTLEGRGGNFVISPININPSGEECFEGVVVLAKFILERS